MDSALFGLGSVAMEIKSWATFWTDARLLPAGAGVGTDEFEPWETQQAQRVQQVFFCAARSPAGAANCPASSARPVTIITSHRAFGISCAIRSIVYFFAFFSAASIFFTYLSGSLLKSFRHPLQQSFTSRSL